MPLHTHAYVCTYMYAHMRICTHTHTHTQEVCEHTRRLGNQEAEQAEAPSQQPEAGLLLRPFPLPPPRGLGMR